MSSRSTRTSLSPRSSACKNSSVPSRSDSARISTRSVRNAVGIGRGRASARVLEADARSAARLLRGTTRARRSPSRRLFPRRVAAASRASPNRRRAAAADSARVGDRRALASRASRVPSPTGRARRTARRDTDARRRSTRAARRQRRRAERHRAPLARDHRAPLHRRASPRASPAFARRRTRRGLRRTYGSTRAAIVKCSSAGPSSCSSRRTGGARTSRRSTARPLERVEHARGVIGEAVDDHRIVARARIAEQVRVVGHRVGERRDDRRPMRRPRARSGSAS